MCLQTKNAGFSTFSLENFFSHFQKVNKEAFFPFSENSMQKIFSCLKKNLEKNRNPTTKLPDTLIRVA